MTEGAAEPSTGKRPTGLRRGFALFLVGLFLMVGAVSGLTGLLLGDLAWGADLFNHFWFHYAVLFLATTLLLALLRGRRLLVLSVLMLGLSVWQVWPMLDTGHNGRYEADADEPVLRLLHFNVNSTSGDPAAVAAYLRGQDADVVFLQEISQAWLDALEGQTGPYRLVLAEPRTDNFGIACFIREDQDRVRVSVGPSRIVDQTGGLAQVPAIELVLEVEHLFGPDAPRLVVPVLSLHTLPPVSKGYTEARDAQMAAAGVWAKAAGDHAIVIGDLNATPWSGPFDRLLESGGLYNSQIGFGRQTTWPAGLPSAVGIPIDHCLHGRGWRTIEREVGPACGSDHRALEVVLRQSGC